MTSNEKQWHKNFMDYMKFIVEHQNYKDLPIKVKSDNSYAWIATSKSEIGKKRVDWCIDKALELGFISSKTPYPGMFADVMLKIHPTKEKICQICGNKMSLYYHYPNVNFLKSLNEKFSSSYTDCDHINDIWDDLCKKGIDNNEIISFFITKGALKLNPASTNKEEVIKTLEYCCRKKGKKCLGPGSMSNFPDRFDGFHTYNRCCRSTQDKGRSKENLKSYTKDRRAYEFWSDGNIHAANQFMGSSFFKGSSADHIGPISLGFIHDPRYLQPMSSSDNSSKRDRLQIEDINKLIEIENRTKITPISWQSELIWDFIKNNYQKNEDKVSTIYRDALKQNMINFMYILKSILENCKKNGEKFLIDSFLKPNYVYFKYSYKFDQYGNIISKEKRHFTDRNKNETERYCRIALESVYDYSDKDNRNIKYDLNTFELELLSTICSKIESDYNMKICKEYVIKLVESIENRIISKI